MTTFGNSALYGAPLSNTTVPGLELQLPFSETVGSVEVTGTVRFTKQTMIAFECSFGEGQIAFVWFRDHLVCHTRPVPFGVLTLIVTLHGIELSGNFTSSDGEHFCWRPLSL